jgi:hypothetical protein
MNERLKELISQAFLDVFKEPLDWADSDVSQSAWVERFAELIRADEREACAELREDQPEQEPVAYVSGYHNGRCVITPLNPALIMPDGIALYIAPPRKSMQPTKEKK